MAHHRAAPRNHTVGFGFFHPRHDLTCEPRRIAGEGQQQRIDGPVWVLVAPRPLRGSAASDIAENARTMIRVSSLPRHAESLDELRRKCRERVLTQVER